MLGKAYRNAHEEIPISSDEVVAMFWQLTVKIQMMGITSFD